LDQNPIHLITSGITTSSKEREKITSLNFLNEADRDEIHTCLYAEASPQDLLSSTTYNVGLISNTY